MFKDFMKRVFPVDAFINLEQMLFSVMIYLVKLIGKTLQKQGMDMNDYIKFINL